MIYGAGAYAIEETRLWEEELGRDLGPGVFDENLTTEGVDVSGAVLGERRRIGTTLPEVVQPRLPCAKLGLKPGAPTFLPPRHREQAARRPDAPPATRMSSAPPRRGAFAEVRA